MSFQVNPNNYLSQEYNDHCSKVYSLALSDPKKFYDARANVTKNLKRDIVKKFYENIFSVLSTGKTSDGSSVYGSILSPTDYPVQYPTQKINEIALSFASTIDKMLDEITTTILPDKINKVVEEKLSNIGKSSLPF